MSKSRWEEILSVAAKLFREKGYRATRLDDIAVELRITKPALYYYIDSKHDLLYAICESAVSQLLNGAKAIMGSVLNPEEKLRSLIHLHVGMFSKHGDITNVYLADENELPPDKRLYVRGLSREYEAILRETVTQLGERGYLRVKDVPMIVRAISGMCNWLSSWYRSDGPMSAEEIADIFCDLILEERPVREAKP
jgi:AcrR family transcriptional regulator